MRSRVAVFVDAGYLWACAAETLGQPGRHALGCDYQPLIHQLIDTAVERSALPLLRVYWYDGAPHGNATPEQRQIASIDLVTLRVGRLTAHGKQKGVDAQIHRDMTTLARNRAIDTAILISGDDDLTEAVDVAKEHGVLVCCWGLPTPTGPHQSRHLLNTCDLTTVLPDEVYRHFHADDDPGPAAIGAAAGTEFLGRSNTDELTRTLAAKPRIPAKIDGDLLRRLADANPAFTEQDRHTARAAFWDAITDA